MAQSPLKPRARTAVRALSRSVATLATLSLVAWLAAPALSTERYEPEPRDFAQQLGPVERLTERAGRLLEPAANEEAKSRAGDPHPWHAGQAPVRFMSHVIGAPGRFDIVGLAGETREVELRVRLSDGSWTAWYAIAAGDPLHAQGGEAVQLRTRGFRPRGHLHYVNVSGDHSAAEALVTGARRAISSGVVAAASVLGIPDARAQRARAFEGGPPEPPLIGRGQWGANNSGGSGCRPRRKPALGQTRAIAVHHTVTATDYSAEEAYRMVLGICRYHRNGNGWNDIGYNALIDRHGQIFVGRAGGVRRHVIGAHAGGFNSETWGIAALGTHTRVDPTRRSLRAFRATIAWRIGVAGHRRVAARVALRSQGGSGNPHPRGSRVRTGRIVPHRRLNQTACPGDAMLGYLRVLRRGSDRLLRRHPPQRVEGTSSGGVRG